MLRSEMNACNEWVGAALYLLNPLMPAFGTRVMPVCSGTHWCVCVRVGGLLCKNNLVLYNLDNCVMLVQ